MLTKCVSVLGILFVFVQSSSSSPTCGDMEPQDSIYIALHGELNLTCTLKQAVLDMGWSARNLYFAVRGERLPSTSYTVLSPAKLRLYQPNITVSDDNGSPYTCYLNATPGLARPAACLYSGMVSSAMVYVGNPPSKIDAVSCVSPNYANMTCTWCSPISGMYSLTYDISGRTDTGRCICDVTSGSHFDADSSKCCRCDFCAAEVSSCRTGATFYQNAVYRMNITGWNRYGASASSFHVVSNVTLVKPGMVVNTSLVLIERNQAVVTWLQPDRLPETLSLVYTVTWQSQNGGKQELRTTNRYVNITSLRPYTSYIISVRSIPEKGGFTSAPSNVSVTTLQDVPSKSPVIPPGAYRQRASSCRRQHLDHCCSVTMYWQGISHHDSNGKIQNYTMRVATPGGKDITLSAEPWDRTYIIEDLLCTKRHTVFLSAYTVAGRSPESAIVIGGRENVHDFPMEVEAVLTRDEDHVRVIWSAYDKSVHPVQNYTLLWCTGRLSDGCKADPSFKVYDRYSNEGYLNLTNRDERPLVAVAANYEKTSSGMSNWICICERNITPGSLHWKFSAIQIEHSLTVTWKPVVCRHGDINTKAYITSYIISWRRCERRNEDPICKGPWKSISVVPKKTKFTIQGLLAYTPYSVKISAVSKPRYGAAKTKTQSTPPSAPDDVPGGVTFINVTSSSFVLRWSSLKSPNGNLSYFKVIYGKHTGARHENVVHVKGSEFTADGLDGYVRYFARIQCCNEAGCSPYSTYVNVTTYMRAPVRMNPVVVSVTSSYDVNVTWAAPHPANGPIRHFLLLENNFPAIGDSKDYFERPRTTEIAPLTYSKIVHFQCSEGLPVHGNFSIIAVVGNGTHIFKSEPSYPVTVTVCIIAGMRTELYYVFGIVVFIVFVTLITVFIVKRWWDRNNVSISAPPKVDYSHVYEDIEQNDDYTEQANVPQLAGRSSQYSRLVDINVIVRPLSADSVSRTRETDICGDKLDTSLMEGSLPSTQGDTPLLLTRRISKSSNSSSICISSYGDIDASKASLKVGYTQYGEDDAASEYAETEGHYTGSHTSMSDSDNDPISSSSRSCSIYQPHHLLNKSVFLDDDNTMISSTSETSEMGSDSEMDSTNSSETYLTGSVCEHSSKKMSKNKKYPDINSALMHDVSDTSYEDSQTRTKHCVELLKDKVVFRCGGIDDGTDEDYSKLGIVDSVCLRSTDQVTPPSGPHTSHQSYAERVQKEQVTQCKTHANISNNNSNICE